MPDERLFHAVDCLAIGIEVSGDAPDADPRRRRLPVITPLDERGELRTLDGRVFRYPDGAVALAAALNAQPMQVRIDFDHTTEPTSHTYRGSTAAEGWLSEFAPAPEGGVTARADVSHYAAYAIAERIYGYVSPVLIHDETGLIHGLSSLALTNRPALGPAAHLHEEHPMSGAPTTTEPTAALDDRERTLTEREAAADARDLATLTAEIDRAVASGLCSDAEKASLLGLAQAHRDGLPAGCAAVRESVAARNTHAAPNAGGHTAGDGSPGGEARAPGALPGDAGAAHEALLTRRIVPAGAPAGAGQGAAAAPLSRQQNAAVARRAQIYATACRARGDHITIAAAVDAVNANLDREGV